MSLCLLPRRTAPETFANAVRRPTFALPLLQRVCLNDAAGGGAHAYIIGRRRTPQLRLPQYLTLRLDSGETRWLPTVDVTPIGTPRLELVPA